MYLSKAELSWLINDFLKSDSFYGRNYDGEVYERYCRERSLCHLDRDVAMLIISHILRSIHGGQLRHSMPGVTAMDRISVYSSGSFSGLNVLCTIVYKVYNFVCKIISGNVKNQGDFDREHDLLCSSICGGYISYLRGNIGDNLCPSANYVISGSVEYGSSQKIVNLTLKYIFVDHFLGKIPLPNAVYNYFHCPIDRYVLYALYYIYSGHRYFRDLKCINATEIYWKDKPWSKLNCVDYLELLKGIKNVLINGMSMLELDLILWSNPPKNCKKYTLSGAVQRIFKTDDPKRLRDKILV